MAQPHQNHDSNLLSKQREEPCCISKTERLKPPHSYIALIATAILNSPGKKLTLTEINDYLIQHYAFFRGPYQGWKNSVRHNLSFNKCFVKILRDPARPWGKDNYWTVSSLHDYLLADGTFRRRRRRKPKRKYGRDDVSNQFLTNGVARELRVHDAQRSVLMLPRYEFLADRVHSSASQATCPSTTSVPFQGSFSIESILADRKPNQEREKSRARKAGTFPDSSVANTNISEYDRDLKFPVFT